MTNRLPHRHSLHSAAADRNPFPAQAARLLLPAAADELSACPDNPPPGQAHAHRQDVAHGASGPRIAGSARHLPVADDLAPPQIPDHRSHCLGERPSHLRHAKNLIDDPDA